MCNDFDVKKVSRRHAETEMLEIIRNYIFDTAGKFPTLNEVKGGMKCFQYADSTLQTTYSIVCKWHKEPLLNTYRDAVAYGFIKPTSKESTERNIRPIAFSDYMTAEDDS